MATGGRDPVSSLAKFISEFNSQLASNKSGSLAQVWMPETGEDGSIVLNTQGLPYSINGVGDLLALFRCISCKYKFTTDLTKTHTMGAVGRVFTSGEPEMSGHVQRYDQQVYLRAAEAQRCQVHSTLFMPIYASPRRDACLAVFEVVLTDADVNFAGMVGWIISCLQSEGLYTAEVDTANIMNQGLGIRGLGPHDYDGASALESGVAPRQPLPGGGGAMRPTLADDGGSERQHAIAAVAAAGSSLDILTATAALPQAQADGEGMGGQTGPRQGQLGGGGGSAPDAKRKRAAGESSGCGGAAQEDGEKPRLQRVPSGPVGLASPAPQQQPIVTGDGSGSGSGAVQAQAQDPAQPQVSHRLSGSLPLRRNGSLPVVLNGMNGSGHLSGSGLPSGSTAQLRQPADATPLAPIVAAAVQQLLAQNSPQLQLAALLAGGAMTPQLPAALGGPFASLGAPGSSGGLAGSGVNGLLMNGTSPAVTAGLRPQRQQAQQQRYDRQEDEAAGGEEEEEEEDEETDDDKPFMRPAPGAAQKYGQGNRVLTYEDLAAQFGYGLKEAASRLNICPTTLKRACRRLGIPRWPRRELVKHKRQKKASRAEAGGGSSQPPPPQQQQQQAQQQQVAAGNGSLAKGLSSGSGPSSGAGNDPQQFMLAAAAAAAASPAQQQQQGLPRPGSSSMLTGLPGLQGMEHLFPVPIVGGASDGSQLAPDLLTAIATTLTQQQQQQQHGMMPAGANPVLVGQVMQFLQQQQQQQQHGGSPWPSSLQPQLQPGGLDHILGPGFQLQGAVAGLGQLHSQSSRGNGIPLAPLLSNLGLPRRGDSKLQSMGHGMGSLDILAAADLEGSVGNMSVGNSPRIAISNLGGLSQLGLSGFDFGGMAAGGEPAATATNDGGATCPQNGPAFSTGAMPARQAEK